MKGTIKRERCRLSDERTAAEKNQPVSQTEISFMRLKEKQRHRKRIVLIHCSNLFNVAERRKL